MAVRNKMWQKIDTIDHVQVYFWIGEFIQSDKWSESSPPSFEKHNYSYHKDGFDYRGTSYAFDNEIHVSEIIHGTSWECMRSIINDCGFRSKERNYPGLGVTNYVWFGLKIEEGEIDRVRENSKRRVQGLMQDKPLLKADDVISEITRTPVFQPVSRHGHFKFTLNIKEVLQAYKTQFCASSGMHETRKLGTFAYKQETMHVILVCPPDTPGTENCPLLYDDPVIQPDEMLETWTWKPHSTGNKYISFRPNGNPCGSYVRWEHVVFALYVPKDCCLKICNLKHRVSLCLATSKTGKVSGINGDIRRMLDWVESLGVAKKKALVNILISMIASYLCEERLYGKTMVKSCELYQYVDLESVVRRLREVLPPVELEDLNWRPLENWMNSLTKHFNILHVIRTAGISF